MLFTVKVCAVKEGSGFLVLRRVLDCVVTACAVRRVLSKAASKVCSIHVCAI